MTRLRAAAILCAFVASAHGAVFEVPRGSAERMLNEWSREAGVQILFDFAVARFYLTDGVRGDMSPHVALAQMLRGTNLTFAWVNDHTVAVTEAVPICRPDSGLPVNQLPLPPCIQGPALGEKKLARL